MRAALRLKLLKIGLPAALFLVIYGLLYLLIPRASQSRRLFDLGTDYRAQRFRQIEVFYQPSVLPEEAAEKLALEFESFVKKMGERWGESMGLKAPAAEMRLFLHSSKSDFDRYWTGPAGGGQIEASGMYRATDRALGVKLSFPLEFTERTIRHEATHMLLDLSGLVGRGSEAMPRWLNEGLAEYFEAGFQAQVEVQRMTLKAGEKPDDVTKLSLDSLLRLSPEEFISEELGYHAYRLAALFVAFLMQATDPDSAQPLYRARFLNFIRDEGRGPITLRELSRNIFGLEVEDFLKRWEAFAFQPPRAGGPRGE